VTTLFELVIGSRLYGTSRPDSDVDLLVLVCPSKEELVSNRTVRVPQVLDNGMDIRTVHYGQFVMSLGHNPSNTIVAYAYEPLFGFLKHTWLRKSTLLTFLDHADAQWKYAKSPKNYANAFLVERAVMAMIQGRELFPLRNGDYDDYMAILDGTFELLSWRGTGLTRTVVLRSPLGDTPIDKRALAIHAYQVITHTIEKETR
jgi:hypothetical protein